MIEVGCFYCKHNHSGKSKIYPDDVEDPSRCLLGNDLEFDKWWKENGNKSVNSEKDKPVCFEIIE